ncbi:MULTISPECIES: hypothetical protein [unclassified Cryobacterium]|uniref:hypothetical protein n=1 Tax=unclassified Cryobacterium TaxID=2649013 RepID=UPI001304B2BB|nr:MULTISPECIES: hypothetical protein [unclassified Cryobacterium]
MTEWAEESFLGLLQCVSFGVSDIRALVFIALAIALAITVLSFGWPDSPSTVWPSM